MNLMYRLVVVRIRISPANSFWLMSARSHQLQTRYRIFYVQISSTSSSMLLNMTRCVQRHCIIDVMRSASGIWGTVHAYQSEDGAIRIERRQAHAQSDRRDILVGRQRRRMLRGGPHDTRNRDNFELDELKNEAWRIMAVDRKPCF